MFKTTTAAAALGKAYREPTPKTKYGNIPCYDASGTFYHSQAERSANLAIKAAADAGKCSQPTRETYSFDYNDEHIGVYTSDIEINVYQEFRIITKGGVYTFEAGRHYTIDVKSPQTMTTASNLRFKMMKAFHGITVFVVLTRPKESKKKRVKE